MKHTTKEALIDRAVGELLDLEMCVKKAHANDFGLFVRLYPIYREMSEILRGLELLPITDEDLWAFGYEYPLYELYKFTSFGQYSHYAWSKKLRSWFEIEVVSRRK